MQESPPNIVDITDRTRAMQLIDELRVIHLKDRKFAEMSTGEQRRFLLGRALIHQPSEGMKPGSFFTRPCDTRHQGITNALT